MNAIQKIERPSLNIIKPLKSKIRVVTSQGSLIILKSDITHLKSSSNYCELYLRSGKMICCTKTLKAMKEKINDLSFMRVHRTFAVNMDYLVAISPSFSYLQLEGDIRIPISKNNKDAMKKKVNLLFD